MTTSLAPGYLGASPRGLDLGAVRARLRPSRGGAGIEHRHEGR